MLAKFLQWITTKKHLCGYVKTRARCMAGFLVTMMVVVTSLIGTQGVVQQGKWYQDAGRSTGDAGLVLAGHYYAPFDIHRQTPVLT